MQVDALDHLKIDALDHDPAISKRLHRLADELGAHQDLAVLANALRHMRSLEDRRQLLEQLQPEHGGIRPPRAAPRPRGERSRPHPQHLG